MVLGSILIGYLIPVRIWYCCLSGPISHYRDLKGLFSQRTMASITCGSSLLTLTKLTYQQVFLHFPVSLKSLTLWWTWQENLVLFGNNPIMYAKQTTLLSNLLNFNDLKNSLKPECVQNFYGFILMVFCQKLKKVL